MIIKEETTGPEVQTTIDFNLYKINPMHTRAPVQSPVSNVSLHELQQRQEDTSHPTSAEVQPRGSALCQKTFIPHAKASKVLLLTSN